MAYENWTGAAQDFYNNADTSTQAYMDAAFTAVASDPPPVSGTVTSPAAPEQAYAAPDVVSVQSVQQTPAPPAAPIFVTASGQIIQNSGVWGNNPPPGYTAVGTGADGAPIYREGGFSGAAPAAPTAPVAPVAPAALPAPVFGTQTATGTPIFINAAGQIIQGSGVWGNNPPAGFIRLQDSGNSPVYKEGGIGVTPVAPVAPTDPTKTPAAIAKATGMSPAAVLRKYLDDDPQKVIGLIVNKYRDMGAAPNFIAWLERNGDGFYKQYLGILGQQALNGQLPEVSLVEFFDWMNPEQQFWGAGAVSSGRSTGRFADFAATRNR